MMIMNVSSEHTVINCSLFPNVAVSAGKSIFSIEESYTLLPFLCEDKFLFICCMLFCVIIAT